MNKENRSPNEPPSKKKKLSLSLKNGRNRFQAIEKDHLDELSTPHVPKNTSVMIRWAMTNLKDWFDDHNSCNPELPCPDDILSPSCDAEVLNDWLCVFVMETRTKDGTRYPPRSIHSLLSGILRHMRAVNPNYPNFLEKNDTRFKKFMTVLDNLFKSLRSSGVGSEEKHTEGISSEEEDMLWSSGVLNDTTADGLLRAVFYCNGKTFCLRGGQEHRDRCLSQLTRLESPNRYVYKERASKNRQGGLAQLKLEHKKVTIMANPTSRIRCPVHLLDKYIGKLPQEAIQKDNFYCRPLPSIASDSARSVWYSASPVGRNQLTKMVATMCGMAGINGQKTNHSLRVAGASSLFDAGVPERIIQARTGHRSLESLRLYERVTEKQDMQVAKILTGESSSFSVNDSGSNNNTVMPCNPIETSETKLEMFTNPTTNSPVYPSAAGQQYNNCTVNMFAPPSNTYFPYQPYPPLPLQHISIPYYAGYPNPDRAYPLYQGQDYESLEPN